MTAAVVVLLVIAGGLQVVGASLAIPDLLDAQRWATKLEDRSRNLSGLRYGVINLPGGEGAKTDAFLHEVADLVREIAGATRITSKRSLRGAGCFAVGTILATVAAIIAVIQPMARFS